MEREVEPKFELKPENIAATVRKLQEQTPPPPPEFVPYMEAERARLRILHDEADALVEALAEWEYTQQNQAPENDRPEGAQTLDRAEEPDRRERLRQAHNALTLAWRAVTALSPSDRIELKSESESTESLAEWFRIMSATSCRMYTNADNEYRRG